MNKLMLLGSVLVLISVSPAYSEECKPKTTVDLSARVAVDITNDNLIGTLATSSTDTTLESISKQAKTTINQALTISKKYPTVRVKTGQTYTHPVFDQNNKKIKSWSIRSEIVLDSKDRDAFSELVGLLQEKMEVVNIQQSVSPERIKESEDAMMVDAIQAFNARAKVIASAMGKGYSIRNLSVNPESISHSPMLMRSVSAKSGAEMMNSPIPVAMGTSTVAVSVNGQIALD